MTVRLTDDKGTPIGGRPVVFFDLDEYDWIKKGTDDTYEALGMQVDKEPPKKGRGTRAVRKFFPGLASRS